MMMNIGDPKIAVFGAGCFYHVERAFRKVKGVISTQAGYMGGSSEEPTYEEVCTGRSGHVQVVEVSFDPEQTSYEKLLREFWSMHDPSSMDLQGPNRGSEYRSVIFYLNEDQRVAAEISKDEKEHYSGRYRKRLVTQILPAGRFWRAEEEHQGRIGKKEQCTCPKSQ